MSVQAKKKEAQIFVKKYEWIAFIQRKIVYGKRFVFVIALDFIFFLKIPNMKDQKKIEERILKLKT